MDNNGDDPENNAKVSDSAYSNSCSNSQSRKSHSSKSIHSGSNSSGSSGYGGKQSTSGSSKTLNRIPEKRTKDKEGKKKKHVQAQLVKIQSDAQFRLPDSALGTKAEQEPDNAASPSDANPQPLKSAPRSKEPTQQNIDQDPCSCSAPHQMQIVAAKSACSCCRPQSTDLVQQHEGFSCVISMLDGVVLYITSSITPALGFPKDMWVGRSFIDFVHPLDHNTFASQITRGLAVPKQVKGMQHKDDLPMNTSVSIMYCRIRTHRGLDAGFNVKERKATFKPFMLKLSFKNIYNEKGLVIYLVIQATPVFAAFKSPNEIMENTVPFTMRHVANGNLEYVDFEAIPYLGFMPQDILGQDVLKLYHPEDLSYVRHLYETIVKQGQVPRSQSFRLMAQNGHYLKVETEWSSFINPWSRKLELVIGKHHVIEGPENPDVFQAPPAHKNTKIAEGDDIETERMKESIVMILTEVPTKPAEVAKQLMTKRRQDLATFMESLIEEQPNPHEELRLEIHDVDNTCFERDSVILGGISPHHDYSDSKSSSTTPISYNQLNFDINLKRYFNSHQESFDEDILMPLRVAEHQSKGECMSPMAHHSGDSVEMTSVESICFTLGDDDSAMMPYNYRRMRLTESLLTKHNSEMEKIFVKQHRETRPVSKEDREKMTLETKQKKKDHLVRCNAAFVPAPANSPESQCQGLERGSKQLEAESEAHKQHCASTRQMRRRPVSTCALTMPTVTVATVATTASMAGPNFVNGVTPFVTQQMSLMSPVTAMPGFVPMYYVPTAGTAVPCTSAMGTPVVNKGTMQQQFHAPTVQYMMYGQTVFGSPIVMSPINHQLPFPMQQDIMQNEYANAQKNLGLTTRNYEEACNSGLLLNPPDKAQLAAWREEALTAAAPPPPTPPTKTRQGSTGSTICSATNALKRSIEAIPGSSVSRDSKMKSEVDRTDDESSYSSFYSSFFETESASAEDSGDAKKRQNKTDDSGADSSAGKPQKRKMGPPWMEHVCVTSELIYKYQVLTKSLDEVLISDKKKLVALEQPSLVNEQLGQLYMDLQLEGVAARLTLEESVTSSSSSSDDSHKKAALDSLSKRARRKRKYSQLVMIYEENAPLPPPDEDPEPEAEPSTSIA